MTQMIFVNLPVSDIGRSRKFYAALGFSFDDRFCDDSAACVVVSDAIFLMIMTHDKFRSFSPRPIPDTTKETAAIICLSRDSREAVDVITEAAIKAGGSAIGKTDEMGDYMYGRSFCDPDGNVFAPMWMDVEAAMKAWGQAA